MLSVDVDGVCIQSPDGSNGFNLRPAVNCEIFRERPSMERHLVAVVVADVVDYGRLSQIEEEATRARFQTDVKERSSQGPRRTTAGWSWPCATGKRRGNNGHENPVERTIPGHKRGNPIALIC